MTGCDNKRALDNDDDEAMVTVDDDQEEEEEEEESDFDLFLRKYPNQRPPNQDIRQLARKLCGTLALADFHLAKSGEKRKQPSSSQSSSSSLSSSSLDGDLDNNEPLCRVSWNGIHPRWFTDVFANLPPVQDMIRYGCRMWFLREFAILELLRLYQNNINEQEQTTKATTTGPGPAIDSLHLFPGGNSNDNKSWPETIAAPATAFISFTGSYTIAHFVQLMHHADLHGRFVWIDTFCVDQFAWTTVEGPHIKAFKKTFTSQLQAKIERIGYTTLLLDGWKDIHITMGQIWVLWEMYATAKSKATLRLLFTEQEHNKFIFEGLLNPSFEIYNSLADIDAHKAASLHAMDKEIILNQMAASDGVAQVNSIVCQTLRNWITETGKAYIERLDSIDVEIKIVLQNNLANCLGDQGHFEDAEDLHRQVLSHSKDALGEQHEMTNTAKNNLAECLVNQGNYSEAVGLYKDSLEKRIQNLGQNHPDTLNLQSNLAGCLSFLGKKEQHEALSLYRVIVDKRKEALGDADNDTLISMNNLATCLDEQGEYEESVSLYEHVLDVRKTRLGPNHLDTVSANNNYANCLVAQGQCDRAEPIYREVWKKREQMLGKSHPDTLTTINNLANCLDERGNAEEAKSLYMDAVNLRQKSLGDDHPETLVSMNNLAIFLKENDEPDKAEELYRKVLEKRLVTLGPTHPNTLATRKGLAIFLDDQDKSDEAEPLHRDLLKGNAWDD